MSYITNSKLNQILHKADLETLNLKGDIVDWRYIPLDFISPHEEKKLLYNRFLQENPDVALEFYKEAKTKDELKFVFEGANPAYHETIDCIRISSDYVNFIIPEKIKDDAYQAGGEQQKIIAVNEFRNWFKSHQVLLSKEGETFLSLFKEKWGLDYVSSSIESKNTGTIRKDNIDLETLRSEIDLILAQAGKFYVENRDKQIILRKFAKYAFYFSKPEVKIDYDGNMSEEELKFFLHSYHVNYKKPLFELLQEYYRVRYNPELQFKGKLLDVLGFSPCGSCSQDVL